MFSLSSHLIFTFKKSIENRPRLRRGQARSVQRTGNCQTIVPSPFESAQGFIGVAFRINEDDSAFESIYLRPKVGRSDNQSFRNKTVQYYAYPEYKFDKLRKQAEGKYETTAPVDINEWITMRIEIEGSKAYMYINDAKYSTFVVDKMLGNTTHGAIGLWVDIGTVGYFKDLKVTLK